MFKDADSLSEKVKTQLLPPLDRPTRQRAERKSQRDEEEEAQRRRGEDSDPLRIPSRNPRQGTHPHWLVMIQTVHAKLYNKTHELIVKYVHFTVMCDTQLWLAHICNVPGFSLFCICGKKRILPETMSQIEIITNALLTNFSISTYFCSLMRFSHQHRIK